MGKKMTLGGDRLGSGNRNKLELHNYFRSNHNLSCARITSMGPGVLYPMYTTVGLTGDTFDIDLSAFVRTLPTEGPMFGAFKLQCDVFTADYRLYQAILHNNTTEIGMDMDQVILPKIQVTTKSDWVLNEETNTYEWKEQINRSSLLYYMGLGGVGRYENPAQPIVQRKFNANPILAYYDIFKNYYSNKQEENAFVISGSGAVETQVSTSSNVTRIMFAITEELGYNTKTDAYVEMKNEAVITSGTFQASYVQVEGTNLITPKGELTFRFNTVTEGGVVEDPNNNKYWSILFASDTVCRLKYISKSTTVNSLLQYPYFENSTITTTIVEEQGGINLQPFALKNIDNMRKNLLTSWNLGEEYVIESEYEEYPYKALVEINDEDYTNNTRPMQGLVVKCYQSDMFTNWLDSEWVAKVTEYSKVQVTNGAFSMDMLNLAKKMYNHYNRVAVTGGTYDDWQLAAYGEENYGKSEKPVYHGGMSAEVIFDEVVSSVGTADEPLGSLGGRGSLKGNRGGHVIIKCKEACTIMIMVSLTPRVAYTEGNAWYLTELDTMDDLHKPEFDRIGFQDLMAERMAWWDTIIDRSGNITRSSVGKQPAWIEYMTEVDRCYGDFAQPNGRGYMVLQRLYDYDQQTKGVADITAYIDPNKYNYAFANASLTAQNFWTFLNLDIKARRKMSAKQMPNL